MDRFVVIGGGVAAHRAVLEMCTHSDALITMISLERELPYDRTALSKRFMDDMDALITLPGADGPSDLIAVEKRQRKEHPSNSGRRPG
jgi:hypothetical protein